MSIEIKKAQLIAFSSILIYFTTCVNRISCFGSSCDGLCHDNHKFSETFPASFLTERVGAPQRRNACRRVAPVHFASSHQVLLRFPQHGWKVLVGSCKRLDAVLDGAEDLRGAGNFIPVELVDLRKCKLPTEKWNLKRHCSRATLACKLFGRQHFYLDFIFVKQNHFV